MPGLAETVRKQEHGRRLIAEMFAGQAQAVAGSHVFHMPGGEWNG